MTVDSVLVLGADSTKNVSISLYDVDYTPQGKYTGNEVTFTSANPIVDTNEVIPSGKYISIYGYQSEEVRSSESHRNTFYSANISDLVTKAASLGMELKYAAVTWNERLEGSEYSIRDFRVGIIVKLNSPKTFAQVKDVMNVGWLCNYENTAIADIAIELQGGFTGAVLVGVPDGGGGGGGEEIPVIGRFTLKDIALVALIGSGAVIAGTGVYVATKKK